jgi:hypothetical protein
MNKLVLIITCLVPVLSFAANVNNANVIDVFQEQCAKEKDPVKRQNSCHMLDQHSGSQAHLPDFHKEIVTV